MPVSTEERRRMQKRQAVCGAAFFALLQLACAGCFAALCLIPGLPLWAAVLFGALALSCAGLIVPALAVLKKRFQEIEGGELDAAAEY